MNNIKGTVAALFLFLAMKGVANTNSGTDTIAARKDLAAHLQIPVDQVALVSVTEKNWRDSSLGCARPGMMYAPMMTQGKLLILRAQGKNYYYHAEAGKPYFYCQQPTKKSGAMTSSPLNKTQ